MHSTQIIKRPLVTEKSTWEADRHSRYAFLVDRKADKTQIRAAIEQIYGVRVTGVRTQLRKEASYRTRRRIERGKTWKKAIVALHPDDRIELI